MNDQELEEIIREYVDKSIHMSLATCVENQPWVSEVHFVYDDDLNLYFRSLPTRRHSQEIAQNPHVAGNIVRQHELTDYPHAVYFEGEAGVMTDEGEFERVYELMAERLGADGAIIEETKRPDGHAFYKITVKNWSAFGKFGRNSGDKYTLAWGGK